jgi:hypothetical protein
MREKWVTYIFKLAQQVDQGPFAKRVGDAGVEGHGWIFLGQDRNPLLLKTNRTKQIISHTHFTKKTKDTAERHGCDAIFT